ncbi:unnamed protein product [Tetraodon nigroviridis]|uniref:(spotted green pufferfish) hypothetical protein n=1 Tax=Tetraodon nigroviridis TaxID=99883 RepID=Q4SUF4_TETNG|nr:unnamed protein product [Tetraodon nigroviridis]
MAKLLTLLLVLMLCCHQAPADAFSGCHCLRIFRRPIPFRIIKQVEMIPISGQCRRPETILTRRNGSKDCIDPNQQWFKDVLRKITVPNSRNVTKNATKPGNF